MNNIKYICENCRNIYSNRTKYIRHINRKYPCKTHDNTTQIQLELRLRQYELQINKLKLEIEKYKLQDKYKPNNKLINNGSITNNITNNITNIHLTPYNEKCIDPDIITPEYALTGIDGVVDLLEQSTILPSGKRNFICTDISRNVFYRVDEKLQWVRDVDAKYIKAEIFPILAVLYRRASRKIEKRLDGLVSDDVSLEEKRQNLAILICFLEMCSSNLHQKVINKLKNKINVSKEHIITK